MLKNKTKAPGFTYNAHQLAQKPSTGLDGSDVACEAAREPKGLPEAQKPVSGLARLKRA